MPCSRTPRPCRAPPSRASSERRRRARPLAGARRTRVWAGRFTERVISIGAVSGWRRTGNLGCLVGVERTHGPSSSRSLRNAMVGAGSDRADLGSVTKVSPVPANAPGACPLGTVDVERSCWCTGPGGCFRIVAAPAAEAVARSRRSWWPRSAPPRRLRGRGARTGAALGRSYMCSFCLVLGVRQRSAQALRVALRGIGN